MIFFVNSTATMEGTQTSSSPQHSAIDEPAAEVLLKLGESVPLSVQLETLTKDIGMRDVELADLAGVSRATLARWRKEGGSERPHALDDLRAIAVLLIGTGAMSPKSVSGWLRSRNVGLDWNRPLDALKGGTNNFSLVLSAAEAACGGRIPVKRTPTMADGGTPPSASKKGQVARGP